MNTDYINFMSTIRVFVSMVLQFGYEWPLSAHAQILITNWLIVIAYCSAYRNHDQITQYDFVIVMFCIFQKGHDDTIFRKSMPSWYGDTIHTTQLSHY